MSLLTKLFPIPSFITLPAVGLDFSDVTLRFVSLKATSKGLIPHTFAQVPIPEGIIKAGRVLETEKLILFLKEVQKKYKLKYVRVSIPESQVYSFTTTLSDDQAKNLRGAIELALEDNIPLKSIETVFDYHVLYRGQGTLTIQVVAVPETVAQGYFDSFISAGMVPLSFELEGQAIARAVLDKKETSSFMIVDFGANRTGISIVNNAIPITSTTIEIGGKMLTQILAQKKGISVEEAERLKKTHGLIPTADTQDVAVILKEILRPLQEEINRRFVYWSDQRASKKEFPPIEKIYICGGHSNLLGLKEHLSESFHVPVAQANPWVNCFSLDTVIPSMSKEISMSYVTAIGLALADHLYD